MSEIYFFFSLELVSIASQLFQFNDDRLGEVESGFWPVFFNLKPNTA